MLWDPGSISKEEGEGRDNVPITPILVPLQNKPPSVGKPVPVPVPDVQELKDQFQQQQNMLTQIKETLKQNESQLSSKEKQVEAYANRLSQIRARTKHNQEKKPVNPTSPKMQKKLSRENVTKAEDSEKGPGTSPKNRKKKVSELQRCLEENKIKFEQRTGKEQSETKKIESLVEQLKTQLEERDKTIQVLQKTIEEPAAKSNPKRKQKSEKESVASKTTQTNETQPSEDSIEIITLRNKIYELEANVLDLEENIKEKDSVIKARTQAVTLLSQDLSLKGKNTLESLEETRQEMRTMQNNFIAIEDQLKKDLMDRDNRLANLEEKYKKLESTNFELSLKNAEQQEKLVNLQAKYLEIESERNSMKESMVQGHADDKLEELTKKINVLTKELDDRNKAMIKMKIEHKNKIKNWNKTFETLKGESDDKAEIIRLSNLVLEFENIKTALENQVAELEDEKAVEKKLKDQINELELTIQKQNEDISLHLKTISNLEVENRHLVQANQDQNIVIENLHGKMQALEIETEAKLKDMIQKVKGDRRREGDVAEANSKGDVIDRKELEEYLISAEISNIHVEEQIELLIREKQALLEKLKSLSGISSTDSLSFEKMEHSDLRDDKEAPGEEIDSGITSENRTFRLEKIVQNQEQLIDDLQKSLKEEKDKMQTYQEKINNLEGMIKQLEDVNSSLKHQIETSEMGESDKNTKSNTNNKNRMKKIEMELAESKRIIQEQNERLKELAQKLEEKEELIKKYTEKIELFEKDDWDRQNHWKNAEDECDNVQELQKKCLSLENSLIELSEDCERLRKENIEVVHLLSEEKVKRRKLLEEMAKNVELKDAETQKGKPEDVEGRINKMNELIADLEGKIEKLEMNQNAPGEAGGRPEEWSVTDLQEKLEWTNVVLTSKETEVFKLQSMLEDSNKSVEILESDLKEYKLKLDEKDSRLSEIIEELKVKEVQLSEISGNFDRLQENMNVANEKTAINEAQLKELLAIVKRMEEDVFKKESELQEIKGILAEKNLDMTNLRDRLEEVNCDLTHSYQEHLENMNKCLRDKETEYDTLLAEKAHLEDLNRSLTTEKENIQNQNLKIMEEKDKLMVVLSEKEKLIVELNEKLKAVDKAPEGKNQRMEDMKIKMKNLAADLKKKTQIEGELQKRVKELEAEVNDVTEKWTVEKTEKEMMQGELSVVMEKSNSLEGENAGMRERLAMLEIEITQVQILKDNCQKLQIIEKEDKCKIEGLKSQLAELTHLHQNVTTAKMQTQEANKEKETLLQKLAEVTGKYERVKFQHDQLLLEKTNLDKCVEEIQKAFDEAASENSRIKAKVQENLAVIESLETELEKTRHQVKAVEERLYHSEERRLSLENKNEEMCRKIMEDSENQMTIDDLYVRVDQLLKSEKSLQDVVKNLEIGNGELKQMLDQVQNEKYNLENDLKISVEKLAEMGKELKTLKDSDVEKGNVIRELAKEVDKLKAENRQISAEFEKLNRDYEQFEVDFKENLENSQNIEKTLRHKIEELTSENAALTEKCNNALPEGKVEEEEEDKKPKKRKSVTFRTDEVEYIKDLKSMLHNYDDSLKQANEEIENLKAELFRERLRHEVSTVVSQAEEKVESLRSSPDKKPEEKTEETASPSSPEERKFDASTFFGNEAGPDALMWDDEWGAEGHLEAEYLGKVGNEERIKTLEAENEKLSKDIQEATEKYTKTMKKLKEVKMAYDKLQSERKSGFGDLDAAIVDELKAQIEDKETKEKELLKNLENSRLEKENLLKRIETLSAGNEKFLELKERQDNEVEIWKMKNYELLKEIADLRQLKSQPQFADDNALIEELKELKNSLEALEWKNCELNELLEEKQEQLQKEREERKPFDEKKVNELNEQVNALAAENDMLQNILAEMKTKQNVKADDHKQEEIERLLELQKQREQSIMELEDLVKLRDGETQSLRQMIQNLEMSLRQKEEELNQSTNIIQTVTKELEEIRQREKDHFETVDLNQTSPDDVFRMKIVELESLVSQREDELQQVHQSRLNDIEELRERIFKLEDMLRMREEELRLLQSNIPTGSDVQTDVEILKNRIVELEQQLKSQGQANKEPEKKKEGFFNWSLVTGGEAKNTEQELKEKTNEINSLKLRIAQLEEMLRRKDEELNNLNSTNFPQGVTVAPQGNVVDVDKEGMIQRIIQLEEQLRLKEEEVMKYQRANWAAEPVQKKEEAPSLQSFFNWSTVAGESKQNTDLQQELQKKIHEIENLKQRIYHLESQQGEVDTLKRKITELENQLTKPRAVSEVIEPMEQKKEVQPLSSFFNWGLATGNESTQNKNEEILKQRIAQLEEALRVKDEELSRLHSINAQELECGSKDTLNQRIMQLEEELRNRESELANFKSEVDIPNKKIEEMEYACRIKVDALNQRIAELEELSLKQSKTESEPNSENVLNWSQVTGDKSNDQFDVFNWNTGNDAKQVQNTENYQQRILQLEELLRIREDELARLQNGQNIPSGTDELMKRVFELEEHLRLRDEEIKRLQSYNWGPELQNAYQEKLNEVENLKIRITQLEDAIKQKETQSADWGWNKEDNWEHTTEVKELQQNIEKLQVNYQTKANEVETLKGRLAQVENELTRVQSWPQDSQKVFDFENALRYKEEEIDNLRGRITELENLLPQKDEEISRLITKLNELEKSYNDSKLEIERLLNEEKLNTEEKFVEPFQKDMQIPVAFEVEALSRTLDEEKQKSENLKYELSDKEKLLAAKNEEIQTLTANLGNMEAKLQEEHEHREESLKMKHQLETVISELQKDLENSNLQLNVCREELQQFQIMKDEAMNNLKQQLSEVENELLGAREREKIELEHLRSELSEKTKYYQEMIKDRKEEEEITREVLKKLEGEKMKLEKEVEILKEQLEDKEKDIESLGEMLKEERDQVTQLKEMLEVREREVEDLKGTLTHLQDEIGHFRNFEKQVKELRQMKEAKPEGPVIPDKQPDLSDWSEHELAELSARLQSDLDTALYMLHQRDVRCDELTFELMQLLEERDTLQLRLSTALRMNEELKALTKGETIGTGHTLQESKDLVDQSNDRQARTREPGEDLHQLASKISELHSVSYLKDKTVKDDTVQRHNEQMSLLSRVSDSEITLSRDVQSSPAVLLNWVRGKTTPKVMHI